MLDCCSYSKTLSYFVSYKEVDFSLLLLMEKVINNKNKSFLKYMRDNTYKTCQIWVFWKKSSSQPI